MTMSLTRALVQVQKKATGQTAEALETSRKLLADRRARKGDDDPEVLNLMNNYATMLQNTGDLDGAEEQFRATLAGARRVLGEEDPRTLHVTTNLAVVYMAQNKLTEAEELFAYVLAGVPDDPNTFDQRDQTRGVALWNYGATLHRLEKLDEAEAALLEAYPLLEMALGPANRHAMSTAGELGKVLKMLDDPARAEQAKTVFEDLLHTRREKHGDDDPGVLAAMSNTALVLQGAGDLADAEALFGEALTAAERTLGDQHQLLFKS